MKVDTIRRLDRFVGVPLCWLFSTLGHASHWICGIKPLPRPRKVLIIKLSEMGSTVLAYPALMDLKKRVPDAELFFLVFENNAAIVNHLTVIRDSNIITVDMGAPARLITTGLAALWRLWRERIDTTIDMDFFSRMTALIAFAVCRGNRVGFHRYAGEGLYRGNLLTHRLIFSPYVHTSVAFMALVRTLFENSEAEPHYRNRIDPADLTLYKHAPLPQDLRSVQEKLQAAGIPISDRPDIILINPNSSDIFPLRKWPLDYFAQLTGKLLELWPACWLVITGVTSEQQDARYILERVRSPRCIDFTGKTNFPELLALYSLASLMVTNDSGPAHFASLAQLPTIVLFGPETPQLYSPLGLSHRDVYANFACSPCVSVFNGKKSLCTDNRCLQAIDSNAVLKLVQEMRQQTSKPTA